jgi:hypothetical protein
VCGAAARATSAVVVVGCAGVERERERKREREARGVKGEDVEEYVRCCGVQYINSTVYEILRSTVRMLRVNK